MVDSNRRRAIGVLDRHRRLLGAVGSSRVSEAHLVLAGLLQLGGENDFLLPFPFTFVVDVVVAKIGFVACRFHPVTDFLCLQVVDENPCLT